MSQSPRVLIELGAELDRAARGPIAQRRLVRLPKPGELATALAVAAAVAVAAIAVISLGRGRRAASVAPGGHAHRQSLRSSFAALLRPRTAGDRIPLRYRVNSPPGHPVAGGLEFARSRRVVSTAHEQLWLVPASRELCTVEINSGPRLPRNTGLSMGCITIAGAKRYGLEMWSTETFTAILPDGTSPVRLTFRHGGTVTLVPDSDGVVSYHSRRTLRSVAFTAPNGTRIDRSLLKR